LHYCNKISQEITKAIQREDV